MPTFRVRREPPAFRRVEVLRTASLSPWLLRVTLVGSELASMPVALPAASVRLLLPAEPGAELTVPTWNGNEFLAADGTRPTIRTYTPRRHHPQRRELDIDVVLHDQGVVAAWAAAAQPGSPAAVSGPGRGYAIDESVRSFLLAGDEAAIPAISQLLEVLPARATVQVLIEVAHADARHALPQHPGAEVAWLDLPPGAPPGQALVAALSDASMAPDTRVWAAGEAAAMQRLRHVAFEDRGLARSQAVIRGYWKIGRGGDVDEG